VSNSGDGSPGNESEYYGAKTIAAIQAFQKASGIVSAGTPETTGYGNFGPSTRTALNEAYAKVTSQTTGDTATQELTDREVLLQRIAELMELIAALRLQQNAQNEVGTPTGPSSFTQPLYIDDDNADVKRLQQKLNRLGFLVAPTGVGSPENESTYFGPRTTTAIQAFQCAYNIVCGGTPDTTGYGNFGPQTRTTMNSL
jgi:peptidoglycan hydrolase-like protein with peptidoglycan-binding domain